MTAHVCAGQNGKELCQLHARTQWTKESGSGEPLSACYADAMDIEKRRADGRCSKRRLRMYAQNRTAWNDVNYMRGRNGQKMAALVSRCRHTMPTYWTKKETGGMSKRRNIWFEIK